MSDDPRKNNPARLILTTLGSASLTRFHPDGEPDKVLKHGKPLALLIYLAASANRTASREHLIDTLWADAEPERSLRTLRQTIWQLRQSFGENILSGEGRDITLSPPLWFDRDEFISAAAAADYEKAVSIYKGSFIPDFGVPGGADFEQWADRERDRLQSTFLRAAEALIRTRLDHAQYDKAIIESRRLRDADPSRESSWRLLLEALASSGDRLSTLSEADELERYLASENREAAQLTVSALSRARKTSSAPRKSQGTTERLIAELTGRDREFSRLTTTWTSVKSGRFRHLHVSAPPGLGKTRLLQDVFTRLRAGGARAVYIDTIAGDRRLAYALASDLAARVGVLSGASGISTAAASSLVSLNPSLSASFAASPDRADGEEALRRRIHAFTELLEAVAEEAPLALFVDDLHWSDPVSRQLLKSVFSRVSNARVFLLTSARVLPEGELHLPSSEIITLDPLTFEQIGQLIGGFGTFPEETWVQPFLTEMYSQTRGSPLLVLENLHLALDRQTLRLEDQAWSCPDERALIDSISRGDVLERRLNKLDSRLFDALLLLAIAEEPVTSRVAGIALARDRAQLETDLADLEQLALANFSGDRWKCSHDTIAEAALHIGGDAKRRTSKAALGVALASPPDASSHELRLALQHFVEAGRMDEAEPVFRRCLAMARSSGDRRSNTQLAIAMLGESVPSATRRHLIASLPLTQRIGLSSPARFAAALAALVVAIAVPLELIPAKPANLAMVVQPLAGTTNSIVPSPVVEIRDKRGNRLASSGDTVTVEIVTGNAALEGTKSVIATNGRAVFTDLYLSHERTPASTRGTVLTFKARGLRTVTSREFNLPNEHSTLRLVSGILAGQTVGPNNRTIRVLPGGTISGTIHVQYSSLWASASVILGATPTWGDRRKDFVDLAPLTTPVFNQPRRANLSFRAPVKPGLYHIVVAFDAEGNVEDFMSGTNWKLPEPVWNDGNDIADWNSAQFAHANKFGWAGTRLLKINELNNKVEMLAHPVPATVIDVVVR